MRGRPIETAEQTIPLFVFVWLSDNRRFVLLILALVLVLLLFVTIVVDWVSRRHSVAGEAQPSETVSRVALDHVGPIRAARACFNHAQEPQARRSIPPRWDCLLAGDLGKF